MLVIIISRYEIASGKCSNKHGQIDCVDNLARIYHIRHCVRGENFQDLNQPIFFSPKFVPGAHACAPGHPAQIPVYSRGFGTIATNPDPCSLCVSEAGAVEVVRAITTRLTRASGRLKVCGSVKGTQNSVEFKF